MLVVSTSVFFCMPLYRQETEFYIIRNPCNHGFLILINAEARILDLLTVLAFLSFVHSRWDFREPNRLHFNISNTGFPTSSLDSQKSIVFIGEALYSCCLVLPQRIQNKKLQYISVPTLRTPWS